MVDPTRVHVDFNSRTPSGNTVFNPATVCEIQATLGSELRNGLPLVLLDVELEVDAVLAYDDSFNVWTGIPNWLTKRDRVGFGDSEFGESLSPD